MGPLEMRDGVIATALINVVIISLMMHQDAEMLVMKLIILPSCFQRIELSTTMFSTCFLSTERAGEEDSFLS